MTYAEQTKATRARDDEHMIYEMGEWSQYEDGSVLHCRLMTTFVASQVASPHFTRELTAVGIPAWLLKDLRRNAKAALKNGTTTNLAPRI